MAKFELTAVDAIDKNTYQTQCFGVEDFAADLRAAHRGVTITPRDRDTSWVYREGDPYAMGWIGYMTFTSRGKKAYAVYSPNISNGKYTSGVRQNMMFSESRAKAVKNALKHIRPLTMDQCVIMSRDYCDRAMRSVVSEAKHTIDRLRRDVARSLFDTYSHIRSNPAPLEAELRHLVESGHKFLNPEVGEKLAAIFGGLKEIAALNARDTKFTVVIAEGDRFRVLPDHDVSSYSYIGRSYEGVYETYGQGELPEEIMGKLAVLSMVEAGHYVEGVGYKENARVFYLR